MSSNVATQQQFVKVLSEAIEFCNSNTEWRRERNALKGLTKRKPDPHTDAYLVSGSNPSSSSMLNDMEFTTQLSMRNELSQRHEPKPKVIEARRRSLKAEHCLQVTLDITENERYHNDYDISEERHLRNTYSNSYDDGPSSILDYRAEREQASSSHSSSDELQQTPYKVYMENVTPEITATVLTQALRYCGTVNDVKFMRSSANETVSSALGAENPVVLSSDTLLEKFGIKAEARESKAAAINEEKGISKGFVMPKNPLAVLASVKRRIIKKKIVTVSVEI